MGMMDDAWRESVRSKKVKEEEKIFERFYSERPTGQGFEIHSGLGLSIARQIAEAHGGKLSVKNLFEGAEFLLTLPIPK